MTLILVIEDEPALLDDMLEMLEFAQFEVRGVSSGEQAVKLAGEVRPDLILCDISMPRMDGYEVLRQLRAQPVTAHTPFIFVSARADRASQREGMDLGADDFIIKPFNTSELLAAIRARLQRQAQVVEHSEQRLEQVKQQLARMVTHELRTPLISINTVVEVISRQMNQLDPAELQELLGTIDVGSKRLTHRVEQLVYITQLDSGILTPEIVREKGVPIQLWELLVAASNLARRFMFTSPENVSLQMQNRDPEALVLCNPPALKQAFAELIANALTFAPPDSVVYLNQWRAEGQTWVSITDQGNGIPEAQLGAALRAFEQIDRHSNEQQGIGIGLTLAHRVIQAHGGALALRSVVGKGTQVVVNIPIHQG